MERRTVFRAALAGIFGLAGQQAAKAERSARANRAAYHLTDPEKVEFVLASVLNHLSAANDIDFHLLVVAHGPALKSFRREYPFTAVEQPMSLAIERGAKFYACANTLASENLSLNDLLPGFLITPRGGVTYLADLQAQGWAYLRP